jgi:hypothetical protein
MQEEIYKIITGSENYEVSSFGNIRNANTKRMLKHQIDKGGYCTVVIYCIDKRVAKKIHRLVAITFLENEDDKPCIDHIDGNRQNNHIENLRFATYSENSHNAKTRKDNISGHKGIRYDEITKRWRVRITIDGTQIHLGGYVNKEDAIQARITRANQAFGVFVNSCEKV